MLTTYSWGEGTLIHSTSFYSVNILTTDDIKLSTGHIMLSLGRDAHDWLSHASESQFRNITLVFFLQPFLPLFPSDEKEQSYDRSKGKGSQGIRLHTKFCSLVSPLGSCFGDNASPPIYTLHLTFQCNPKIQKSLRK